MTGPEPSELEDSDGSVVDDLGVVGGDVAGGDADPPESLTIWR